RPLLPVREGRARPDSAEAGAHTVGVRRSGCLLIRFGPDVPLANDRTLSIDENERQPDALAGIVDKAETERVGQGHVLLRGAQSSLDVQDASIRLERCSWLKFVIEPRPVRIREPGPPARPLYERPLLRRQRL